MLYLALQGGRLFATVETPGSHRQRQRGISPPTITGVPFERPVGKKLGGIDDTFMGGSQFNTRNHPRVTQDMHQFVWSPTANRNAFDRMDLDSNGSIDADELGLILKSFGEAVPASRVKALMREVRATQYDERASRIEVPASLHQDRTCIGEQ